MFCSFYHRRQQKNIGFCILLYYFYVFCSDILLTLSQQVNGTNYYVPASRGDEATGGL